MRLLKELYRRHNRYTDIITLDSLYAKAPIINEITSQNMIAVIRVKQQDYHIICDAEGLFAERKPTFRLRYRFTVPGTRMMIQAVVNIITG